MTRSEYQDWLAQATPGETSTYHVGNLASDRVRVIEDAKKPSYYHYEAVEPLNSLADDIWQDYERGLVMIVQIRVGLDLYAYTVRRTQKELA